MKGEEIFGIRGPWPVAGLWRSIRVEILRKPTKYSIEIYCNSAEVGTGHLSQMCRLIGI
jgi:hypothetical protein